MFGFTIVSWQLRRDRFALHSRHLTALADDPKAAVNSQTVFGIQQCYTSAWPDFDPSTHF
jgi:hypothetical protein